jgi:phosphopantetheinyl transferase (holo-ACP synthase)
MTMPAGGILVRSATSYVAVAEVAARRAELADEHCTPAEREELAGRHVQSLAGNLALKQALVALLAAEAPESPVRSTELELRHRPDGAPELVRGPLALRAAADGRARQLYVSISHTRSRAVGLAVLAERRGPP